MSTVRYHPDAAQRELAEDFGRPFDALLPLARLHHDTAETAGWAGLATLGLFGIAVPEAAGGVGLGAVEEALVAGQLGRRLAAPTVLATLAAVHGVDAALAADIAGGATRVAPAWRGPRGVTIADGDDAAFLLLRDGDAAAIVPVEGVGARTLIDERLWLASLTGAAAAVPGSTFAEPALLRLWLIDAAALAGMAAAALDMSVGYAKLREQFRRPIGSFQAIKHRCADMAMAARAAADQTSFAAVAIDDARDDAPLQVHCALLLAMQAALANARANIQVHGGIGFSDEADPNLLLKRAHLQTTIAGGAAAAAQRVAAAQAAL